MAVLDKYNVIKITEEALMRTIKENVVNNIVDSLISEFKEKAEQEVKKEVEKLSINGVTTFRDMANMRDEVKVYCEWNKDN